MAETEEQQALLKQITRETQQVDRYLAKARATRIRSWELMAQAKDEASISSYSIAKAAGISQPRVMQVIKELKELQAAASPSPTEQGESPNGTSGSTE